MAEDENVDAVARARTHPQTTEEALQAAEDTHEAVLAQMIAYEAALGRDTSKDEEKLRASVAAHAARRARDAERMAERTAEYEHRRREARGGVLVVTPAGAIDTPEHFARLSEQARAYAMGARSPNTEKAYKSDLRHFRDWCEVGGIPPLPNDPEIVGQYLADLATRYAPGREQTYRVATLERRLASIAIGYALAKRAFDPRDPRIRDVMRGIRRAKGVAQDQAAPLTTERLRLLLATCGERLIDLRDRALLLLGFTAALRQSEIVALDAADITVLPQGLRVVIRRSKGDQEGEGQVIPIHRTGSPTCPVAAYAAWINASGIEAGAMFRRVDRHGNLLPDRLKPEAVADMIRTRAGRAGLPDPERYSGHSLRAGLATSAAAAGVEERVIQGQTRHRSVATLRRYIREGALWDHNITAKVGL